MASENRKRTRNNVIKVVIYYKNVLFHFSHVHTFDCGNGRGGEKNHFLLNAKDIFNLYSFSSPSSPFAVYWKCIHNWNVCGDPFVIKYVFLFNIVPLQRKSGGARNVKYVRMLFHFQWHFCPDKASGGNASSFFANKFAIVTLITQSYFQLVNNFPNQ